MNRMITLDTSDYGPVTFNEPDWCTRGGHNAPEPQPARPSLLRRTLARLGRRPAAPDPRPRRSEISHQGDAVNVTVPLPDGEAVLLELTLWQDVFPEPHWPSGDRVYGFAEFVDTEAGDLDVAALDELADAMHDAARQVREFANHLALQQPRDGGQ